jgi:hypothetical protein
MESVVSLLLARIAQAHRGTSIPSDPYFSLVQSLLAFNGADGSTAITDYKGLRTWAASGTAAIVTSQYQFGGSSIRFGASGSYVETSDVTGMSPGTQDFAVEFWWRPNSLASAQYRTILQGGLTGIMLIQTAGPTTNALIFYGDGATTDLTESSAASNDIWHFYKLSRSGTSLQLERDGTVTASATILTSKSFAISTNLRIGTGEGGGSVYGTDSWIDDFRLTVGTSRPGSGVPTVAFPTS